MPAPSSAGRNGSLGFSAFAQNLFDLVHDDGRSWAVSRSVDSTNSQARRYLAASAQPSCFVAWEQTEGRGRRGRAWSSGAGLGLYLSLVLPEVSSETLAALPLLVPCALAHVVGSRLTDPPRVKWPNDLLASGRKLAGILIEASTAAGASSSTVIGVGVNCRHEPEQLPSLAATSLRLEGAGTVDMAQLARDLVRDLDRRLGENPAIEAVVAEYESVTAHRSGDRLRCRSDRGELEGRFAGFAADGALLLECEGGIARLRASEILET